MMRDLHLAAQGTRRQLEALARKAEVPLRCRVVRGEPLRALTIACAEVGPWNVVALGEPFAAGNGALLKQMLAEVSGTTGIVTVGPRARRVSGPVIVAVEARAALPDMLRLAERRRPWMRPKSCCCWWPPSRTSWSAWRRRRARGGGPPGRAHRTGDGGARRRRGDGRDAALASPAAW
jgi:hypothetical protein